MLKKSIIIFLITLTCTNIACQAVSRLVNAWVTTSTPTSSPSVTASPTTSYTPTYTLTTTPTPLPSATPLPPTLEELLARCPSSEEISAVDADLSLIFESDPSAGQLVCTAREGSADLTRLQERTYQAILTMRRLRFDAWLPWTNKPLYDWFVDAIDGIRFRDDIDISFCCEPKNIINIQTNNLAALKTNLWIDPQIGGGLQGLLVLLIHEARHNEDYQHTCGVNDNSLAEMGAWGVQYYFLQWLAFHSDPYFLKSSHQSPDYYREAARDEARWVRINRFCAEATITLGPPQPLP